MKCKYLTILVATMVSSVLFSALAMGSVINPDDLERYTPTTNWAPTAANEGWLVNQDYGSTTFSIGNAYGLTGQGVASSTDYAMGQLWWTKSFSTVTTPLQTFSCDFYLGDPYGGDQRLLLSQETTGGNMIAYLTLRNRGGVGQCFLELGGGYGTKIYLPGQETLALHTWMHVDLQSDWTNQLVRARIGVVGQAMQNWSAWGAMATSVQYAHTRFITGEGEVRLDNVTLTAQPLNSGVTGTVTSLANGSPIEGAEVSTTLTGVGTVSVLTNASGVYTLGLPPGTYTLQVQKFGYMGSSVGNVVVNDSQITSGVDIALATVNTTGPVNPEDFERYSPTTNWAPTAANEGWAVNSTGETNPVAIGNAYGLTGKGMASSPAIAKAEALWYYTMGTVSAPLQTFSFDFYLGDPIAGDQRLLFSPRAGLSDNIYLCLRNRGGVGQAFLEGGTGYATNTYLPGQELLALHTWMHADVDCDWKNHLTRARIGVVGGAMQDWSTWAAMTINTAYDRSRFILGEGEVRVDNVSLSKGTGITGTVTSLVNGSHVEGAEVSTTLSGGEILKVSTDQNGVYTLVVPEGSYTVTVSKIGYETSNAQVALPAQAFEVADFTLSQISHIAEIGDIRKQADGTDVSLAHPKVVTSGSYTFAEDAFYVEERDRSAGIKVVRGPGVPAVNRWDEVLVDGILRTDVNGERYIEASALTTLYTATTPVRSLSASTRSVCDLHGLRPLGLLVNVWGRVTSVGPSGSYAYVDDGAGFQDGSGSKGIRVVLDEQLPPLLPLVEGQYVIVTGIVGMRNGKAVILPRAASDVHYVVADGQPPLSFKYEDGTPTTITVGRYITNPYSTPITCQARTQQKSINSIGGTVYVYCSFRTGHENPSPYLNNQPAGYQIVTLGKTVGGSFLPVLRFGIVDDDRASVDGNANYVPGAECDIEYYGMYCRPNTVYDFKIVMNMDTSRATIWVSGRGDDEWFPLAVNVLLWNTPANINAVRVDMLANAQGIDNLVIQSTPWPQGEVVRAHPLAKTDRVVGPSAGFTFQQMKSLWRMADRHVTMARNPNASVGWWLGFPDVVRTGPNSLVSVYVDGAAHGGGGKIWAVHSNDLGQTWGNPVMVFGGPTNCPRIVKLQDGSLVANADEPSGINHFFRSTDGGYTWTNISTLDPIAAGGNECVVPSRVFEMPDGSWLVAGSHSPGGAYEINRGEQIEIYHSTDRGASWHLWSILQPPFPLSICEPSIIQLPDGRLMLVCRESSLALPGVKSFSNDNGLTWSPLEELPFYVVGRTCAALLEDGRLMLTTRSDEHGAPALWAWVGNPDEPFLPLVYGAHFNDHSSLGLRDGELHIDSDGMCGQFTRYDLRVPDSSDSLIDVTAEVKVVENKGRAATLSVPFVGKMRIFPDRVEFAHDPSLQVAVTPGVFHTYRLVRDSGVLTLYVDGVEALVTSNIESQIYVLAWSALNPSTYRLEFGNEAADDNYAAFDWVPDYINVDPVERQNHRPNAVFLKNITPAATGYSIWKRLEVRYDDPTTGIREASWDASSGRFPDQYQLDNILEVEATISGEDQGYSGWAELDDGRIFVVQYTDDTARTNCVPILGVPWIRGTFVDPTDLPPFGGN